VEGLDQLDIPEYMMNIRAIPDPRIQELQRALYLLFGVTGNKGIKMFGAEIQSRRRQYGEYNT
jgi:hypothetical protein